MSVDPNSGKLLWRQAIGHLVFKEVRHRFVIKRNGGVGTALIDETDVLDQ